MKTYDFEQRTPEWYAVRDLKFTATDANTVLAMGKGVDTLIGEKLAEHYSSEAYEEYTGKPSSYHLQRGVEFEDKARAIYELETGNTVTQVGFCELNENVGCSPDGLVGDNGLIEIKNHSDKVFLKLAEDKKIDKKYLDQMQYQMYVTGREWCDYFGFNPNFTPSFIKIRVHKDQEVFDKLVEAIPSAVRKLQERKKKLDLVLEANEIAQGQ